MTSDGKRTYTWEHGRELAEVTQNGTTWTNTYDANGLRTKRTNGTTTYRYRYTDGMLATMNINDDVEMWFMYDGNGPMVLKYGNAETHQEYHYELNLQGDVIAIISTSGERVVEYAYDAWGNVLSITGSAANTIGVNNPLRYRGYVYDQETELYYLQSRYYDPELGRFINADAFTSTGQGLLGNNMFAYCGNNPICNVDPTGEITIPTLILIGSAIFGAANAGYTAFATYQAGWDTSDIIWYTFGSGVGSFLTAYSLGTSFYQVYLNYCAINAIAPVTEIGPKPDVSSQLQTCANTANASVPGSGHAVGSRRHTVFASEVNALGNSNLRTEVSYLNGQEVPYGTRNSIRFDVLQYTNGIPCAAWDLKTGTATLTSARVAQMQAQSGLNIPIFMLK